MKVCDVCSNEYEKAFQVVMNGKTYTFDSFECAIHALALKCEHCHCRIIGHGMEDKGATFCCAHCARMKGHLDLKDHGSSLFT